MAEKLTIETLAATVAQLDERVKALETKPAAAPSATAITSTTDLHRTELAALEKDPSGRIASKVAAGLSEPDAIACVEKRKAWLRSELGIVKAVKAAGKAAAIILAAGLLGCTAAAADYQGYPSTPITPTNLPAWPTATLTNATAIYYSLNSQATNFVVIIPRSGLAVQFIAAVPYGGGNTLTNSSGVQTNATGTAQLWFYPSVDGTNAITPALSTFTLTPNTTNAVIAGTNWSELTLRGYSGLFYTVSNGCTQPLITGGSITNVQNGVTNVYPAGLLFNRPNL